ncbi:NAD-dependent epimerase/dehydratase family protein [Flavimaricola marinus]|uniref:Short chain dehydrogenase n=1 Tax=Flavimaricola marinus TaxID=1819565 RepID=A0A238LIH0_9RHOB|nr:NAD-dependent epimerase/dehydratase family protein [Flavimaricola marinus]SMY09343.1 short chain dehydrogenase [Flavimaricola marinus]
MTGRLLVTGASGFLGQVIVEQALADKRFSHVIACDRVHSSRTDPKLSQIVCGIDEPALRDAATDVDVIIHLAAMLGGAAEADQTTARRVNLDATLALIDACRPGTRFVFASSLAALGNSTDDRAPVMVYGAHKAMVELAIESATRRGEIDGISLRPGGIVARAVTDASLKSAFLSRLFWAFADGTDITLPVAPNAQTWLASVRNVATNFIHGATASDLGGCRSVTLPMIRCRFDHLVAALRESHPQSNISVKYAPQADIMRLFGQAQDLSFKDAITAGFKADKDLPSLIHDALQFGEIR